MTRKIPLYIPGLLAISLLGSALGCSQQQKEATNSASAATPADDAQITSSIQAKLYADPVVQTKQISVQTSSGVVTLAGAVASEAERGAAASAAAGVPGVKTVVNNLTVTPVQAAVEAPAAAPISAPVAARAPAVKRQVSRPARHSYPKSDSDSQSASVAQDSVATDTVAAAQPPAPVAQPMPATPPPPARVTVQSGTTLSVRLVDSLDSETSTPGQTFRATLNAPLAVDGDVVVPEGYDVQGHVVDVKSAGKFAGKSLLALQLDRIQVGTKYYNITTNQYSRQGSNRTTNTVEKVGAGSVIGAIIGGIAGGGKGAGIGAAAGGGIGGGVQAATKGQQIKLPTETVLTFELQAPLTVTPTTQGKNSGRPKLDSGNPDNTNQAPSSDPQRQ